MEQNTSNQYMSGGLQLPWSWCSRCERAYVTGTAPIVRLQPDSRNSKALSLELCAYPDCNGDRKRVTWPWAICRAWHPEYPLTPERNVIYPA